MKKIMLVAMPVVVGLLLVASCGTNRQFPGGAGGAPAGAAGAESSAGMSGAEDGGAGSGGTGPTVGGEGGGDSTEHCTEDEKSCSGACVAIDDPAYGCDPTLCSATRCPDSAGGTLACEGGECVIAECGPGTKSCGGTCVALTDPAFGCGPTTCDASSCPSQATGAAVACEEGQCVIDSCPAGYKECVNECVAVSDPTYGCGETSCDDAACPAPGNGTVVCQDGACVLGSCGSGTKNCDNKCVPTDANNGCADPAQCTACADNEACMGSPSTCQCVPTVKATACAGKCGSIPNGCGGMHACGGCTTPQTCGGGGTDNVCGCTNTPLATACAGKSCGSVSNGCGGTYTCGSCTSPTAPICVANACRECAVKTDCPAGAFACSNNTCVCRPPSAANLLPNPGFDGSAQPWAPVSEYRGDIDADGCDGSGSVGLLSISEEFWQCLPATGGATYFLSFRFRPTGGGTGYCNVIFYSTPDCTGAISGSFEASASGAANTWRQAPTSNAKASDNAVSMRFGCGASLGFGYYDQMYLGTVNTTY